MPIIYAARWVLPISSPMLEEGGVAVDNSRIVAVGPRRDVISRFPEFRVEDFGEAAILPGFINAHSHLELTVMRGFLEREERDFFAWLRKLTLARMAMTSEDLLVSATCGAIEAARAGITLLADASSAATEAMSALGAIGLRGIVYQESFGPDPGLAKENLAKLRAQIEELRQHESTLVRAGVSPHAPYTVSAPQLELISRLALDERLPLMIHAAESRAEELLLREGRGFFAEGLKARGIEWQPPGTSTIQYLSRHGVLETRPLLAHCINVDAEDLDLIYQSRAGVAHCPKSNLKLGHGHAPVNRFLAREIKFGLGSDSVASNNNCDLLEEARFATLLARLSSDGKPDVNPTTRADFTSEDALFAATLGGARSLGLDNQIGALAEGMQADIAVVGLSASHQQPVSNPVDTLIFSSSGRDVVMTVVAGKEVYRNNKVSGIDEGELGERIQKVRMKLDSAAVPG
ncbi:MAG: amidohydrolase family protein [Acidobacteriota bacterium]